MSFSFRKPKSPILRKSGQCRPQLEMLEDRVTPATLTAGVLTITGTAAADQITLQLQSGNAANLEVIENGGTAQQFALANVNSVVINGNDGNDTVTINQANGFVGETGSLPLTLNGGPGQDILRIQGNPGGQVTVESTLTAGADPFSGSFSTAQGATALNIAFSTLDSIVDISNGNLTINGTAGRDIVDIFNGPSINGLSTLTVGSTDSDGKIAVLHQTGSQSNPTVEILVDEHAVDAHLRHGDTLAPSNGTNGDTSQFVPITFANKSQVTINTLGGNDLISLESDVAAATGLTSLTLNGGDGALDRLNVRDLISGVALNFQGIERFATSEVEILVQNLYERLLDRAAADSEVQIWVNIFNTQGISAVVSGIALSGEARTNLVINWYEQFLGRTATPAEVQPWVQQLQNGTSEIQVLSSILGSAEFQARADLLIGGSNTNENYVRALYLLLLNRTAAQSEVNAWVSNINANGRTQVALSILGSQEFRINSVQNLYLTFLDRTGISSEWEGWASSNQSLTDIRLALLGTTEYFENA